MSDDVIIHEAGIRLESGKYCKFIESRSLCDVEEYIEIMKLTKPIDSEIVKYEKVFRCISTTPTIVN